MAYTSIICSLLLGSSSSVLAQQQVRTHVLADNGADMPQWPQTGYDAQHTSRSPYSGAQANVIKWTFNQTGQVLAFSPVIGADGTVYVSLSAMYAFNGSTGEVLWSVNPTSDGSFVNGAALGANGLLYVVGATTSSLYALDTTNMGKTAWTSPPLPTGRFAPPTIGADGTVFVGNADTNVYALDGDYGQLLWSFATEASVSSAPALSSDQTTLFVGSGRVMYALDATTGTPKWTFPTGNTVTSSPAAANGCVYFGSANRRIYCLEESSGKVLWQYLTKGPVTGSPSVNALGEMYIGSGNGPLYAFSAQGTLKWYVALNTFSQSPAIAADGTLYVGSLDGFQVLNPDTGASIWKSAVGVVPSSPALAKNGWTYAVSYNYVFAIA